MMTLKRSLNNIQLEKDFGNTEFSIEDENHHKNLLDKKEIIQNLLKSEVDKGSNLNEKQKEIFELESKIEEEERKYQAEQNNHQDTLHHKDTLFSGFENNQDRVIKDLKIQYEGITNCIDQLKRLNKDSASLEDLSKNWGLDKTHSLLASTSTPSYDQQAHKETLRQNANLMHQIEQAKSTASNLEGELLRLQEQKSKLKSDLWMYSNFKVINEGLKVEVEEDRKQLRQATSNEEQLEAQKERLQEMVQQKQKFLENKKKIAEEMAQKVKVAEKVVEMRRLHKEVQMGVQGLKDKANGFRNRVKLMQM